MPLLQISQKEADELRLKQIEQEKFNKIMTDGINALSKLSDELENQAKDKKDE